ncbi:DMT family transporter [Jatrophihabitans fulvus]
MAFAAALWGLDGLLRKPLATDLDAGTVVLWEHLIVTALLLPVLPGALRAFATRCTRREQLAVVVIGVGSSAVATALFTESFALAGASGDYITPLVLQKLQPVFAVLLAVVLLHERLRARYALYAVPALAGAWLLTFPHPSDVQVSALKPALFAIGAAVLWAAGTVLGRLVSASLTWRETTALRFAFGLVGAVAVVQVTDAAWTPGWGNMTGLVLLALIPGLIALAIYYRGLRSTAASRATLAELAFPATAALVGVWFLNDRTFTGTQWVGLAVVAVSVVALGWNEQRRRPAVAAPEPERVLSG